MNTNIHIDKYIAEFPEKTKLVLEQLRQTIRAAAPDAEEVIGYQMPAFKQNGILVYFAGYKNHIGFYPTGSGIEAFKLRLSEFKWSKGTIQFLLDKPLPVDLITEIVQFRISQNLLKRPK